jgi:imidazolonepropionase-like amidohydrolase
MLRPSFLLLLCSIAATTNSCQFHGDVSSLATMDYRSIIADNIASRSISRRELPPHRTALVNVRVFDGSVLQPPGTVIIDGDRIGRPCTACEACAPTITYDGQGMTLLPGLIDSHAHPVNTTHLTALTRAGVTTAVNAFCPAPPLCASLRNHTGLAALVTASFLATASGSTHAQLVGPQNADLLINSSSQAPSFVARQVAQGADFIKVIGSAPLPGLTQMEQTALVAAAHAAGKQVVLHTASYVAYAQGLAAGVDQIHHAPLDVAVDDKLVGLFRAQKTVVCPTLTMMRAIVDQIAPPNSSFATAAATVAKLHKSGIPILAGTDANLQASTPAQVQFGSSLHDELENLVAAGLSQVEALNAATVLPARHFGLADRGAIKEGMLADLVLVNGDPTVDITATRKIVKVWVRGVGFDESA